MKGRLGECCLCGKYGELSFEHVPPQSAFNNKPIYIQTDEHLSDTTSKVFGKKMKSNRGFGSYTLCKDCNNKTGTWYAKDFGLFAKQGLAILQTRSNQEYVRGMYDLKPLNVFKQIVAMFLSADKGGHLRSKGELTEFILDKNSTNFPSELKIFIYSNASPVKRMMGYCIVWDPSLGLQKWSEINFQPFGYFLTENSVPASQYMVDITEWHNIAYDQLCRIEMTTAYLKVTSPIIGTYG